MNECEYSPQISPGNADIVAMSALMPFTPVERSTILLQHPYDTPTLTLELRNPSLNDKLGLTYSRIQRKSRGNQLIVFRATHWPKSRIFNLAFSSLTATNRNEIIAFIRASLGKEIKYTDYLSQEHKVLLINPDTDITQEGIGCQYTWSVSLQEVIVP